MRVSPGVVAGKDGEHPLIRLDGLNVEPTRD